MSTESCGRCGAPAPEALLRNVSLHVDGSEVDAQTICPDCFSDWIAHYQSQMAGNMPGAGESPESDPSDRQTESEDAALSEAVRAAQQHVEDEEPAATKATPPSREREGSSSASAATRFARSAPNRPQTAGSTWTSAGAPTWAMTRRRTTAGYSPAESVRRS